MFNDLHVRTHLYGGLFALSIILKPIPLNGKALDTCQRYKLGVYRER